MAKGSHATFDGYPNVCCLCGERIVMTSKTDHRPLQFLTIGSKHVSWHIPCGTYAEVLLREYNDIAWVKERLGEQQKEGT